MNNVVSNYRKKNLILIISIIILVGLIITLFLFIRPFYASDSSLESYVERVEHSKVSGFKVVKSSTYDGMRIVLYNYSKEKSDKKYLGITISKATFIKGLYRNVSSASSNKNFGVASYSDDKSEPMVIFYGYNTNRMAKTLVLELKGKKYSNEISDSDYYICTFKNIKSNLENSELKFYDKNNKDISSSILKGN
ncbi:hypothetical protein [Ruminiclostridium cellulolyticum]|uniref:DUF4825 domain-containing protein n=1 Tax=Ruminiclostridium cellulolyticum (strain ATCC 35319 / DSM 5812 / JCM 6584 / H10) TaxID=394503 RepID=B8I6R4_RUMCH|nr:hypothetical protein [Ruminiclostridium cellulolyticum]ACL76906.1 hypothetical protein Ccel_2578 [Ruminiclostridium cellulolyticum H10]